MTPSEPDQTSWQTFEILRSALRRSRRERHGSHPVIRGDLSDSVGEDAIEVPVPLTGDEDADGIDILHVDDDPEITELTKLYLEQEDEHFTVTAETNAVEALSLLEERDFDCIISDYEMPNTDGLEFLQIVRETRPNLPFILFTAKGSETIASDAFAAGATDYMQKEIGSDQYEVLANRVRNAVDQFRTQQRFWDALSWYQRLVEQELAGVFIVQEREFIYVNKRFADIFGRTQRELIEVSPLTIASDEEAESKLQELIAVDPTTEESFQYEFIAARRGGVDIPVEVHGGTIQHEGTPGCIGLLWDRSDRSEI